MWRHSLEVVTDRLRNAELGEVNDRTEYGLRRLKGAVAKETGTQVFYKREYAEKCFAQDKINAKTSFESVYSL